MMVDAAEVLRWIVEHITLFLIPLLVWQTKTLLQIAQTVYGTKGDNGLNGSVRELRAGHDRQRERVDRHEGLFELHKMRMDGIDRELSQHRTGGHG